MSTQYKTGRGYEQQIPIPDRSVLHAIVTQGKPELLVKWAEDIGQAIARQVTTSQIRNIFGTVRRIQMNWDASPTRAYRETVLLKPKLGYFAKRERGPGMAALEKILAPAIDEITGTDAEKRERFMNFVDFFEAILAYHKKHGGN